MNTQENVSNNESLGLQFKVSYNLSSEYTFKGRAYRVRFGCHKSCVREDYLMQEVKTVGTVMNYYQGHHEFPPQEVMDLFNESRPFPLIPARWTEDFLEVEYLINNKVYSSKEYTLPLKEDERSFYYLPYWEGTKR